MLSNDILLLLVKAPTGFSLAMPQPDKNGVPTATPQQLAIHEQLEAAFIEWSLVSPVVTSLSTDLFRVVTRATLADVEGMISAYHLPLTIIHAQDAYQKQTGTTTNADGFDVPIMTTAVHMQATKAAVLKYMPDVVTRDPVTQKELTRTKATVVTIPNCQDMAAWTI